MSDDISGEFDFNNFKIDLEGIVDASHEPDADPDETGEVGGKKSRSRGKKTHNHQFYRRYTSERQLEDCIDWILEPGAAYHVIS